MSQVTYVGRHRDGVFVPDGGGGDIFIAHGDTAEVPDDIAAALVDEQPDAFQVPKSRKAKAEEAES